MSTRIQELREMVKARRLFESLNEIKIPVPVKPKPKVKIVGLKSLLGKLPERPMGLDEREAALIAERHRAFPEMKPSEFNRHYRNLIATEFKDSSNVKELKSSGDDIPEALMLKIWNRWRKLQAQKLGCKVRELDSLGERARISRMELKKIVREVCGGASWELVEKATKGIYRLNREKSKK